MKNRITNGSHALRSDFGWLAGVYQLFHTLPLPSPRSGISIMGTELLVPRFFRRNGELLWTTVLLIALMLLKSLFMLEKRSKHFKFAQGKSKLSPGPYESCNAPTNKRWWLGCRPVRPWLEMPTWREGKLLDSSPQIFREYCVCGSNRASTRFKSRKCYWSSCWVLGSVRNVFINVISFLTPRSISGTSTEVLYA